MTHTGADWPRRPLGQVCLVNPRHPRGLDGSIDVTFVPMPAVQTDRPDFASTENRPLDKVRKGYTHFAEGDVLFAKITPCMENGKAAIARGLTNGLGCGTTELHVLRPGDELLPEYLYHFVHQKTFRQRAASRFTGTAGQLRVPVDFMREAEIPVPPIDEQRRIVAKLEQVLGKVQECKERLDRVPQIMKRFRQAVLAAACSGQLTEDWREEHRGLSAPALSELSEQHGELWARRQELRASLTGKRPRRYKQPPEAEVNSTTPQDTWGVVTVGQVSFMEVGHAFKSSQFCADGIRLLRGENIEPGRLRWLDTQRWPMGDVDSYAHLQIDEGDLILGLDRPLVSAGLKLARATAADLPCLLVQRVGRFKTIKALTPSFLRYNLLLPAFQARLTGGMTGSDLPHVTGDCVDGYTIPLPPLEEQLEIERRVEPLLSVMQEALAGQVASDARLTQLQDSLLGAAFAGHLADS